MTETPAETIRRAAALMRERAQAAPEGPWTMKRGHLGGHPQYISDTAGLTVAECWEDAETAPAASVHIASWHPIAALAVAEWLESEAERAERPGALQWHSLSPGPLAVALAYLGEVPS